MSAVIDEIKARISLVDLIGPAVALRRSGAQSYKGLCPFHQEKTASFYVFPESHTWVCFGCGKRGSAFDWLMEREHLEFGEALRTLAQVAGVELPGRRDPEVEETAQRLYGVLAAAQVYYQGRLQGASGVAANRYLTGRGVNEVSIEQFGLGFAGAGGGLQPYLFEHGYTEDEMVAAAVVGIADDGRHFDFFRDRVLFPIRDPQGRTIAFGGRALDSGTPKYLNSRDTLLFHKQETLFAIDLARKSIAQERRAVVVEGYLDALMAHQHAHRNVVATLGTAVTERHLTALGRIADEIVLALDSDSAGQAATWRALQVAEQGLLSGLAPVVGPDRRRRLLVPGRSARLKILSLPGAKDPDELIRADPQAWPVLVKGAVPVTDFVLRHLATRHDLSTAAGKAAAADEAAGLLGDILNPVEQAHYVEQVADMLRVSAEAVQRAVRQKRHGRSARPSDVPTRDSIPPSKGSAETSDRADESTSDEYALALLMRFWELDGEAVADGLGPDSDDFLSSEARALRAWLNERTIEDSTQLPDPLRDHFERAERFLPFVRMLSRDGVRSELLLKRLEMRQRSLKARWRQMRYLIPEAETPEEEWQFADSLGRLAQEIQQIDGELAQAQARQR